MGHAAHACPSTGVHHSANQPDPDPDQDDDRLVEQVFNLAFHSEGRSALNNTPVQRSLPSDVFTDSPISYDIQIGFTDTSLISSHLEKNSIFQSLRFWLTSLMLSLFNLSIVNFF